VSEDRLRAATERLELTRAFGEQVRGHRKAANLSVKGLAKRCHVPPTTISDLELGRGGEPRLSLILSLCAGLAIGHDTLLGDLPAPKERRT
jgi:transcriptional regulator with XRE-family HTH domain